MSHFRDAQAGIASDSGWISKALTRLEAVLRCGSCRFAAFYFLGFQAAIVDGGQAGLFWLAFGIPFWFFHSLGVELLNRYSDRVEDKINRPERTAICERVGFERIKWLAIFVWLLISLTDIVWLLLYPNGLLAVLLALAIASGVFYSFFARFKARRYIAPIILTFPFGGPFMIGWIATHGGLSTGELWEDFFFRLLPFFLVPGLFFMGHIGIKDITDVAGDKRVGYNSLWVSLLTNRAHFTIMFFVSLWLMVDVAFVATGLLSARYLILLLFWPFSLTIALASARAKSKADNEATREVFYHYSLLVLSSSFLLLNPQPQMATSIVAIIAYWILASQFLHWNRGVHLDMLKTVFLKT
jgi:4-hydroxybenzoate polyprenyltransferase